MVDYRLMRVTEGYCGIHGITVDTGVNMGLLRITGVTVG